MAGDVDLFAYAAALGWKYHAQQANFAGSPFGSDLELRASAGIRLIEQQTTVKGRNARTDAKGLGELVLDALGLPAKRPS